MKNAEVVQRRRHIRMGLSMDGLIDLQRLEIQGLRLDMFALSRIDLRQLRQTHGDTAVFMAVRLRLLDCGVVDALRFRVIALLHCLLTSGHGSLPRLFLASEADQDSASDEDHEERERG